MKKVPMIGLSILNAIVAFLLLQPSNVISRDGFMVFSLTTLICYCLLRFSFWLLNTGDFRPWLAMLGFATVISAVIMLVLRDFNISLLMLMFASAVVYMEAAAVCLVQLPSSRLRHQPINSNQKPAH